MKKVIGGHMYNTETARELGSDSYSHPGDFHHWEETLYRTKSGEYFLYGEGGPMSRYAVTTGQNEWSGGEKILPMTEEKARAWAEEHLDGDEYEAAFGPVEDTGAFLAIRTTQDVRDKFNARKDAEGLTAGELLSRLLG